MRRPALPITRYALQSGGFTLLELVISIGIFTLILLIIVGLYTRFMFTQRRDIGEQTIQEEFRFALELFNREARTAFASTFALPNGTEQSSVGESIVFRNQNGICVQYRLNHEAGRFERAENTSEADDCFGAGYPDSAFVSLTGAEIVIDRLRFDIPPGIYEEGQDNLRRQGYITLMIEARARSKATPPFRFQSTVTSRQVVPYSSGISDS